jgi:hypothetical protein
VSSSFWGLLPHISSRLTSTVLPMCGALSDERTSLSFVRILRLVMLYLVYICCDLLVLLSRGRDQTEYAFYLRSEAESSRRNPSLYNNTTMDNVQKVNHCINTASSRIFVSYLPFPKTPLLTASIEAISRGHLANWTLALLQMVPDLKGQIYSRIIFNFFILFFSICA